MCIKKESNKRDSENAGIVVPRSETNHTNVPNENEKEAIYFDPLFLRLIDICNLPKLEPKLENLSIISSLSEKPHLSTACLVLFVGCFYFILALTF